MDCMAPYYCKSTYTTCIKMYFNIFQNLKLRVYIYGLHVTLLLQVHLCYRPKNVFRYFSKCKVEGIHMDCMSPYYCNSTYTTCLNIYSERIYQTSINSVYSKVYVLTARIYAKTASYPSTASSPIIRI